MSGKKVGLAAASVGVAGAIVLGGHALAGATTSTPTSTPSSGSTAAPDGGKQSNGTAVTGTELATVTAAVKAKDSAVTVTSVTKESDGSYDAFGTKAGANVMFEVSADLKTITLNTRGGGPGGASADTPVTGTEADKASAAVKAKDSAVTVTSVRKDPDGSYDVLGTKAGAAVFYDVSADLKTITLNTHAAGGPGGGGRGGHGHGANGPGSAAPGSVSGSSTASPTTSA